MARNDICPACYGTGWIDQGGSDVQPCERCGGRGIVPARETED